MADWALSSDDPYPTATYQKKQFGVAGDRISYALASPPEKMLSAETDYLNEEPTP